MHWVYLKKSYFVSLIAFPYASFVFLNRKFNLSGPIQMYLINFIKYLKYLLVQ